MSKSIEKEVRTDITKEVYDDLITDFNNCPLSHKVIANHNYYFDTCNATLMHSHQTLRIRIVDDSNYEYTLKIKGCDGDIEINQNITKQEAFNAINNNIMPTGEIENYLKNICDLHQNLVKFTDLFTNRLEIYYPTYTLVIDENKYSKIVDYNIEIESIKSKDEALEILKDIANKYCFKINDKYIGKYHRAINAYLKSIYR